MEMRPQTDKDGKTTTVQATERVPASGSSKAHVKPPDKKKARPLPVGKERVFGG
jgi:hypothetical protein